MALKPERIRSVMRYAVAVAANADDPRLRELGPIHLIKYVYLADLAYAARHDGETYTGTSWRFHHFGPWAMEVWQELQPAMSSPAITHRSFSGRYQDDISRWSSKKPGLEEQLESQLPFEVSRALKRGVGDFGNDTTGLLHHVYRTSPMLRAAPGEQLDFSAVVEPERQTRARGESVPAAEPLSKTAAKRRQAAREELRERFQRALAESATARREARSPRPPRYDEVFARGQDWLDSLAGEPLQPLEGELFVSEEIWKSSTRFEPSIP